MPRIQVLDALRGLCLVIMTIAHVPQSAWVRYTSEPFGYVDALSGFIFTSGLVAGMVYGSTLVSRGWRAMKRRAFTRAGYIYLAHALIWTVLLAVALCLTDLQPPRRHLADFLAVPLSAWLRGVLLLYQPRFMDILPLYCVLFVIVPFALRLLQQGRERTVLLATLVGWAAGQWPLRYPVGLWGWLNLGTLSLLGWQILFVVGLVLGFRRRMEGESPVPDSIVVFGACVAVCLPLFVLRHDRLLLGHSQRVFELTDYWVDRTSNGPLRLLNFAAFAYGLSWILRRVGKRLEQLCVYRWLAYLGRHSLQVFVWSILACVVLEIFEGQWQTLGPLTGTWLTVAVSLTLWIPAGLHELYRNRTARSARPSYGSV